MFTKSTQKDCLIIFPPVFYPHMPYLATASLTAYLKNDGLSVAQKDQNLDFYNYILQQKIVSESYLKIWMRLKIEKIFRTN